MAALDIDALRMIASGNLGGAREHMNRKSQRERDIIEWIKDTDNIDLTVYEHEPLSGEKAAELVRDVKEEMEKASPEERKVMTAADLMRDKITGYLTECYENWQFEEVHKAAKKLADTFGGMDIEEAEDWIWEHASVSFPVDEYLNDRYETMVALDTGDSDYDFSLNHVQPAWNGEDIEDISDEASILWLAEQNGYPKEEFISLMKNIDNIPEGEHPFIKSVYKEIENTSSSLNTVVFLGTMTLKEMAEAQTSGVTIPKRAACGLFDGTNGAGGVLEVELQRDLFVPKEAAYSILPDCKKFGAFQYSLDETYGLSHTVWDTPLYAGEAKAFEPEQIEQAKALCEKPPRVPAEEGTPLAYMQQQFAGAFRSNLYSMDERIYEGMLNRGQFVRAADCALADLYSRTHMDGRKEYRFSEKYMREVLKLVPEALPKEIIDSHRKHFEMVRGWEQGR